VAGSEHGVVEVVNVLGAIAVAILSVDAEGGRHKLHGASGAGVGGARGGAALAGLVVMDGGQDLPGRARALLDR